MKYLIILLLISGCAPKKINPKFCAERCINKSLKKFEGISETTVTIAVNACIETLRTECCTHWWHGMDQCSYWDKK